MVSKAERERQKRDKRYAREEKLYGDATRDADMEQGNYLQNPDPSPHEKRTKGYRAKTKPVGWDR